ncbi:MAG: hypothetical protein Q8K29_14055 [Polaromonas sp.]|nr:hypothetical protein [Polaromonas sp.]
MHHLTRLFAVGYVAIIALFGLCAFSLIAYGSMELWRAVDPGAAISLTKRFDGILSCIAMLTIAMASLELADTLVEEELNRKSRMSHSARVERVLSRFLVVVVISLAIESLVATFKFVHDDPTQLIKAASIAFAAAALLAAWAFFIRLNKPAE